MQIRVPLAPATKRANLLATPHPVRRDQRLSKRNCVNFIATNPDHTVDEVVPRVHRSDLATFVVREFDRPPA
jgi:hypothetical protein